jgi:hypothetical protein
MPVPSLDGRRFSDATPEPVGDVGGDTVFEYHQEPDGTVWARYSGGAVRLGFLVGRREDDRLEIRYSHLTATGETANGRCTTRIEEQPSGGLRLREAWTWESRDGSGTSVVDEIGG